MTNASVAMMPMSCEYFIKKKGLLSNPFGGPDQIRTGVEAFAELCLATRPQDQIGCENKAIALNTKF